ncbi:MAG: hypothetical protein LBI91_07615, partial [Spirochaetaceae bacterium]|nr:hypothetical protein [Spirochaetaceae bacterium]
NQGHNEGIAAGCGKLKGYSACIAKVREMEAASRDREGAMEGAVWWCIAQGILKGFFETHGTEVVNMLMTEWKLEEALMVEREEGLEEGMEKGRAQGREEGMEEIARTLLKKGWSIEETAETVKLGIERVRALSGSPGE